MNSSRVVARQRHFLDTPDILTAGDAYRIIDAAKRSKFGGQDKYEFRDLVIKAIKKVSPEAHSKGWPVFNGVAKEILASVSMCGQEPEFVETLPPKFSGPIKTTTLLGGTVMYEAFLSNIPQRVDDLEGMAAKFEMIIIMNAAVFSVCTRNML